MHLINTEFTSKTGYFDNPIADTEILYDPFCVDLFDQNGYHLTKVEQAYLEVNGLTSIKRRNEDVIRKPWFVSSKRNGVHINHSDLFERKGFSGLAYGQIKYHAHFNPILYKVLKMQPKWGIDISIDYVDSERVFEVFHYEWDSFDYSAVLEKKNEIEKFVLNSDWDSLANEVWDRRDEWMHLDFFGQSEWRTNYFNISPEKFKQIIWEN